jgi:ATP-dependent protease HslVU (ClpYQ) peptidase subunit
MTIITAIHDAEQNLTWLGSNGRATIGSFIAPSRDNKWFAIKGWVIGITGTGPKLEALKAHESKFPKDAQHPFEILKFMREAYGEFDIGEMDEGLKRFCGSGLLIHKSGTVWDFDNSLCLTEVEPGVFWARGSGMDIAIGAGLALRDYVHSPKDLTKRILEIAIANDVDCPGELLIQTVNQNGELSDPVSI